MTDLNIISKYSEVGLRSAYSRLTDTEFLAFES